MLNSLCLLLPVAHCHNMLQPQCCQFFHFQLPKQLRSRWWICRVLLCCKECFPPTSPFRFRTFSPLILVVNLIQPFHFYYAVVSLSCNKANLVLFSVRFDQRTQICLLTLILCNVGTGSAGHKHILDFCSLLGAKGQVSETCHYEADPAADGATDKGLE